MLERVPQRLQYELSQNRALLTGVAALVAVVLGLAAAYITVNVSLYAGFGAVAAGLLGLAIMTNTQTGFVTVIAVAYLLPFAVIPAAVGGVKLTFLDATLTLLLIVWILRLLTHRDERLVSTPLDVLVLLFIGFAVTSFIMGVYSVSGDTIRAFLKTINSIVFFFVLVNNVRNRTQTLELVRALTIAAAVASFFGIALYLMRPETQQNLLESLSGLGYPTGGEVVRYIANTDTLRAVGTSVDPNVLGGMLMLALPLVLVQLFGSAPLLSRRVLALIAVAVLSCLILTFVCPRFPSRSMVLPDTTKISIQLNSAAALAAVSFDGEQITPASAGDVLEVAKAEVSARFATLRKHSFLHRLQTRLNEGQF